MVHYDYRISLNNEIINDNPALNDGDEMTLMPPFAEVVTVNNLHSIVINYLSSGPILQKISRFWRGSVRKLIPVVTRFLVR